MYSEKDSKITKENQKSESKEIDKRRSLNEKLKID
jgi:hypothetical protein